MMLATITNVLGAIAWDPEIRNILSVLVGVVVLCGSVYLLIATNTGIRTGFLIALAALLGWMATMGVIWWIYGIGMTGTEASWQVVELNRADPDDYDGLQDASIEEARHLVALDQIPTAQDVLAERPELVDEILPPDLPPEEKEARARNITLGQIIEVAPEIVEELDITETLDGWHLLPTADRQRGDAVATADAFLGPDGRGQFESSSQYLVLDAFSIGGKEPLPDDPNRWDRIWNELRSSVLEPFHSTHYAAVQVRATIPQCEEGVESTPDDPCYTVEPGEAPPPPAIDEDAPVLTVVMVRDLGDKRFPAFMLTLISTALFAVTCWVLHRRDAVVAARRATAPA